MSLADIRIKKLTDRFAKVQYEQGITPDFGRVFDDIQEYLRSNPPGLPSLKVRPFGKKQSGAMNDLNLMFAEIAQDIEDASEERVDLALRVMRLVADGSVRSSALTRQIKDIRDKYQLLLLREPKASGVFFGVFDSFIDVHKTDTDATTADLDLAAGEILLPLRTGTKRLVPDKDMAVMQAVIPPPAGGIKVGKKKALLRVAKRKAGVVQQVQAGDVNQVGAVGGLFNSTSSAWVGLVRAEDSDSDISLTLDFALGFDLKKLSQSERAFITSTVGGDEFRISRLELTPAGIPMEVRVLYSNDGVNYLTLGEYERPRYLDNDRLNFYFGDTPVEYLRLEMIPQERRTNSAGQQQWPFGLKEIAFYSAGYASSAEFYSRALTPPGVTAGQTFNRAVLFANSTIPTGTDIRYFVADGSGSSWREIGDSNRGGTEVPLIVDFGNSNISGRENNEVHVSSTPAVHETFENRTFYDLVTTIPSNYVKGSVKLWRGHQAWGQQIFRGTSGSTRTEKVHNNMVEFSSDNEGQPLYRQTYEKYTVPAPFTAGLPIPIVINDLLVDNDDIGDTSSTANGTYLLGRVNSVVLNRATPITGTANVTVAISTDVLGLSTPARRTVTLASMSVSHDIGKNDRIRIDQTKNSGQVVSKYFRVDRVISNSSLEIRDPSGLLETGSCTWVAATENWTSDITVAAANTNNITVVGDTNVAANDQFICNYWRQLRWTETPKPGTFFVRGANGTVYNSEVDYYYDTDNKTINRRKGSNIPEGDTIYVNYEVEIFEPENRARYFAEMDYVGGPAPRIQTDAGTWNFSDVRDKLIYLDPIRGEVDITGVQDLSAYLPEKGGIVSFVVESDPIRAVGGTLDTTSAIYKVINATSDDAGSPTIFGPRWFRWRRAIPIGRPATEVPYTWLKQSTYAGDKHHCSVDGGDLVIPYDPTEGLEFIYLERGDSQVTQKESFQYEYLYEQTGSGSVTSVKLKAEFSRDQDTLESLTPVLHDYTIRLAF